MSEQTGPRERVPHEANPPRLPASAGYPTPRQRGMGGSALGLIALGVGAAVIGAVVLGPALGPKPTARRDTPPTATTGTDDTPTVAITPADPSRNSSSSTASGLTPNDPASGTLPGSGTGELASGTTLGMAADPLGTTRRLPHEQMGPPVPPEIAAQRVRERLAELGLTQPKPELSPTLPPDDPRLRGLEGVPPTLEANNRPPRLSDGPLGSLATPAPRETGTVTPPPAPPRSTEPSSVATAPNLSPPPAVVPAGPTGPSATVPSVSVPVPPPAASAVTPPVAVGSTPDAAPGRIKPSTTPTRGKFRYRVRVGQFATEAAAHKFRRQMFQATGRGAEVVPDGEGFRLEIGTYGDSIAAERVADELRAQNYTPEVLEPKSTGAARKE